ncbi:MAG: LexA family transcriptional regulator [Bacteroidales bacterium]|nr:LexA family transcriptional regulator [Bacteroidales bacterium]
MSVLGLNIKYLRKSKNLTQSKLAKELNLNRAMIGSYEENRAIPKLSVLVNIANYFSISLDTLIKQDLWDENGWHTQDQNTEHYTGNKLRVISTVVDKTDKELITTVPINAMAGYTNGYSDPEFIEELPRFSLPLIELSKERTYRVFQIKGDSMLPLKSGTYVICEYLANWNDIINNKPYVVISKDEGVVYKRLEDKIKDAGEIILNSDNKEYLPYEMKIDDVLEIWKALGFISFDLSDTQSKNVEISQSTEINTEQLYKMIVDMKKDIDELKNK